MKTIKSTNELKQDCVGTSQDYAICLRGGMISRKSIEYDPLENTFAVFNHIDDTEEELTEDEIKDKNITNIGRAIKKGAFVKI